jgi:hypothetical protein
MSSQKRKLIIDKIFSKLFRLEEMEEEEEQFVYVVEENQNLNLNLNLNFTTDLAQTEVDATKVKQTQI